MKEMSTSHIVKEAEIFYCANCNKPTLQEVERNETDRIVRLNCVVCQIPN